METSILAVRQLLHRPSRRQQEQEMGITMSKEMPLGEKNPQQWGEIILRQPSIKASGYHQDPEAVGYRSILVSFVGWTLHLVVLYLDSDFDLEDGPNGARLQAIAALDVSMRLPWLVVGDFNCAPQVVATSPWC